MNPLFTMPGGKMYQRNEVIPYFPAHKIYVEPFVGAGGIFFEKPKSEVEVINDWDKSLIFIYRYIQKHSKHPSCSITGLTQKQWDYWAKMTPKNEEQRVIKILVLQQYSWRGNRIHFSPSRGESYDLKNSLLFKRWSQYHDRLQGVTITNLDWSKLVVKYAGNKDVFIYLDPPYETGTKSDVTEATRGEWYGKIDLQQLHSKLNKTKCKWLISFSANKELMRLMSNKSIKSYSTQKASMV